MYKILVINLGSTSTKLAICEDDQFIYSTSIEHQMETIRSFPNIWSQEQYRIDAIMKELEGQGLKPSDLDAVVTRGGHTAPTVGGTYKITDKMLEMSHSEKYGLHPSDLGLKIAVSLSAHGPLPLTVDPPTTDEFEPLAHYSGIPEIKRRSGFHVLNHRAVARKYAVDHNKVYEEINLIGAHMGGGITVAAHKKGRLVDATNGIFGDGPFSSNRTGTFPTGPLVDMCFSGEYTRSQVRARLNGGAGLVAYLGETSVKAIEERIGAGDKNAEEVLMAMCYQTAKEIAAMSAVLKGEVEAIYLTGGVANSGLVTGWIRERVETIAPVVLYPGEYEMLSLMLGGYKALCGTATILEVS